MIQNSITTMNNDNNNQINQQNPNSPTLEKTGDTNTTKLEYTVDEVIEQYVGSLGISQIIQVILVSLAWIFDAHGSLITIFSDVEPSWRCQVNQNSTFDSVCQGKTIHKGGGICGLQQGTWEWVNGPKSSTIAEWSLICDHKFLAAIPASCFFIGSLLGSIVYGRLADSTLGRKKALMLACFLTGVTTFLTSFSPNVWTYAILRFSSGLARSGIGSCCLVLATEVIGRKWRGEVGQYGFFFYTVGFLSLPIMAYPTRYSWRNLYRIMSSFPLAYSICVLPFVVESPRWLLIRGRKSEAISILSAFAKRNGKQLPTNIELFDPALSSRGEGNISNKNLWQCKWAVIRISKAMAAGFGVGFMYYGIQLNVENMNLSTYFAVVMNGLMEIPAVILGGLLIGTTNRRLLFSVSSYVAGVSCFLCIFFINRKGHNWGSWVQLVIEGVGFMTASMAYDVLYIYCVELFPTNVRNFAVSLLRQALMLGAAVAPLFVAVGRLRPAISFMVFGGLAIASGIVSLWLPETKNMPLYETLEQQEKAEKFGACKGSGTEIGLELGENDNRA